MWNWVVFFGLQNIQIDLYWLCVSELSKQSIQNDSKSSAMPLFYWDSLLFFKIYTFIHYTKVWMTFSVLLLNFIINELPRMGIVCWCFLIVCFFPIYTNMQGPSFFEMAVTMWIWFLFWQLSPYTFDVLFGWLLF